MKFITVILFLSISNLSLANQPMSLTDLLRSAKMAPYIRNGEVQGYKLIKIRPGSKFEKLGLKSGDVIKSIDGKATKNPADLLNQISELSPSDSDKIHKLKSK